MEHYPQLLPDSTLWIQLAIFFASYSVLKLLVFKPYLALLRLRQEKTIGLTRKATEAQKRAQSLHQEYAAYMQVEKKKIAHWADEERRQIAEEEKSIVQAARTTVAADLDTLKEQIHEEVEQARVTLLSQVSDYSSCIVSKLMGRKVDVDISNLGRDLEKNSENSPAVPG